MNKKVLTLCVSALLAGGLCTVANASNWTMDTRYVQDSQKYHLIKQVADFSTATTPNWQTDPNDFYLTVDNQGVPVVKENIDLGDTKAYWTVVTRKNSGQTEFQLINAEGTVFTYKYRSGGVDHTVEWFLVNDNSTNSTGLGTTFDCNWLYFYDDADVLQYVMVGAQRGTSGVYDFTSSTTETRGFNNEEIEEEVIPARDLNAVLKDGFGLVIGSAKDKEYTSLQGNVFTGEIEAKAGATAGTYYFYRKADKKYIVLSEDVWSENTANLDGKERSAYAGYKFEAISEHAFGLMSAAEKVAQAEFQVLKSYDFNDTDSLIVTLPNAQVGEMPATWTGDANSVNTNKDKGVRLYVSTVADIDYLTVIEYAKANDRLALQDDDAYADYQVGASAPYVKLGLSNIVDFSKFADKVWNITRTDGTVLAPNVDWSSADAFEDEFDPATQVQLNKPEGQWLPYYTSDADYGFVNRESGVKWNLQDSSMDWIIRSTNTPNLYELYTSKYMTSSNDAWEKVYITEAANAELGKTENGYASFDEAKEALDGKYITLTNGVTGETVYIGKDADDNVILTSEKSNAIEFRIKDMKHDYTDHDGLAGIDTLQHITTYLGFDKDGNLDVAKKDTLQFYHYRLFDTFSEKYLTYDDDNQKLVLMGAVTDNNAHDDFRKFKYSEDDYDYLSAFVLKQKPNNTYHLISGYGVDYDVCNHTETGSSATGEFDNDMNAYLYLDSEGKYYAQSEKMYGAFQTATLSNMAYIYNYNDNDRFAIVNVDAPEYMTITDAQDTVKVSLQNFQNFYLYEQGENGTNFLGMNHTADVDDMKAAIFVDTAYVRNNTYRPQYLLAMNGKHVEPIWDNHPNSPSVPHLIAPDTTYGRFLVNMVDSAKAWKGSDKTNPYIWDKSNYYRLAFIDGIHTGDKLILNTAKAKTTIDLSNNNDKVCTFAFRYVDEDREGVKIETLYGVEANGTPIRGWLKYQNNVPVVTRDYDDAHVFLVDNTTTEAPTANEEISANAVVSVVATDGAVIVKGAEGKNVIVSTILGKVVANEVLNSDNETIAAPAGIVVVSVDGESFKVAVK